MVATLLLLACAPETAAVAERTWLVAEWEDQGCPAVAPWTALAVTSTADDEAFVLASREPHTALPVAAAQGPADGEFSVFGTDLVDPTLRLARAGDALRGELTDAGATCATFTADAGQRLGAAHRADDLEGWWWVHDEHDGFLWSFDGHAFEHRGSFGLPTPATPTPWNQAVEAGAAQIRWEEEFDRYNSCDYELDLALEPAGGDATLAAGCWWSDSYEDDTAALRAERLVHDLP